MARLVTVGAVFGVLLVSIASVSGIPFGPFLGLDLQNLDAFHDCFARNNPYEATGAECGDVGARDFYYPPLLYWSFVWTRLLPFSASALLWAAVVLVGILAATLAWVPRTQRGILTAVFGGLLLLQFPALFSMERGNNDVMVLALWTLAMLLYVSGRAGLSGFVAGASVALKLYPGFAAVIIGCGLIWWAWQDRAEWRRLVLFAAGGVAAVVAAGLLFFDQTMLFLTDAMPRLAETSIPLLPYTHALQYIAPLGIPWLLSVPLLLVWVVASVRRLAADPVLVFAGALAISTYFASVSYDYNLITVYPLLTVLFARMLVSPRDPVLFTLLMLGLISTVGHRGLFNDSDLAMQAHIALQWVWLVSVGIAAAIGRLGPDAPEAERQDAVVVPAGVTPHNPEER